MRDLRVIEGDGTVTPIKDDDTLSEEAGEFDTIDQIRHLATEGCDGIAIVYVRDGVTRWAVNNIPSRGTALLGAVGMLHARIVQEQMKPSGD